MKLSKNFHNEEKELNALGINTWESIMNIGDSQINDLVKNTLCTTRNLMRLRCIAMLICELSISQEESALLMHSGISSIKALRDLTPHELLRRTGRFERIMQIRRKPIINLEKANCLIKEARTRQNFK
tara:strand:- start:269 stop:652 length:384 start_codon:yes stop_codon:yes gene_type:complete